MTAEPETWAVVLQVGHTADIHPAALVQSRDLLDGVFDGNFTDADWEHSLGGMHVIAWYGDLVVGHSSVVQRRLAHDGVALRTGYVEGVGVHPAWQRRGIGSQMMEQLESIISIAYDIGALSASDASVEFYRHRGWIKWLGPTYAMTPHGVVRTADEDGGLYVLPTHQSLDIRGDLVCDWRDGDVW